MNWGLLKWYAALLALIWGVFSVAIGGSLLALFFFGIVELSLAVIAIAIVAKGVLSLYGSYRWFTVGVDEE